MEWIYAFGHAALSLNLRAHPKVTTSYGSPRWAGFRTSGLLANWSNVYVNIQIFRSILRGEFDKALYADPYIYIKIPAKLGDQRKGTFQTHLV